MYAPLSRRVAVVAGATRGAGRGIARMLGEAGGSDGRCRPVRAGGLEAGFEARDAVMTIGAAATRTQMATYNWSQRVAERPSAAHLATLGRPGGSSVVTKTSARRPSCPIAEPCTDPHLAIRGRQVSDIEDVSVFWRTNRMRPRLKSLFALALIGWLTSQAPDHVRPGCARPRHRVRHATGRPRGDAAKDQVRENMPCDSTSM
jgi:hypothetical protein